MWLWRVIYSIGDVMFLTIAFVLGFIIGWWVNEKVEDAAEKVNPLNWFKK